MTYSNLLQWLSLLSMFSPHYTWKILFPEVLKCQLEDEDFIVWKPTFLDNSKLVNSV